VENNILYAKILKSIEVTLKDKIDFSGLNTGGQAYLNQCVSLIGWIANMIIDGNDIQEAYQKRLDRLGAQVQDFLSSNKQVSELVSVSWSPKKMIEGYPTSDQSHTYSLFGELTSEALASCDDTIRRQAKELFNEFLSIEQETITRLDVSAKSNVVSTIDTYLKKKVVATSLPYAGISEKSLADYLSLKFGVDKGISVDDLKELPGGFSKETYSFTIKGDLPFSGKVVMRKDLPVEKRTSSVDEFPVLKAAWDKGIPVPEPLWYENDKDILNGSFIVVKHCPGKNDISEWVSGDKSNLLKFVTDLASNLVKIHSISPQDIPVDYNVAGTAEAAQIWHINWLREHYLSSVCTSNPRIEAAFGWLLTNFPKPSADTPCLVHSGLGFHNLLTHQGNILAILDWEYSHFGDPADDLSYVRQFIEKFVSWDDFLKIYYDLGGYKYTDEQDRFYAVWRYLRNACGCSGTRKVFLESDHSSLKLATSVTAGPRHELLALRQISKNIE